MTPLKVYYTGLELDPLDLAPRCNFRGIIPPEWPRHRFQTTALLSHINRWLFDHIEGRWAIFTTMSTNSYSPDERSVTIAFEHDYDASLFVLSDGPTRCLEYRI
jgi:hypothetical protein